MSKSIDNIELEVYERDKQEKSIFLGEAIIDVATTHRDRVKDVLEKTFIVKASQDLTTNSTMFLNHKTDELPVAKVLESWVEALPDGNYSTRIKFGVSKTAPAVMTLLEEGIINKASIGFYMDEDAYNYDEKSDTLYITSGEVVECSLVGVPANPFAQTPENESKTLFTSLRKSLQEASKESIKTEKSEEPTMDDEKLKSYMEELLNRAEAKADNTLDEKTKAFEAELSEKQAELEKVKAALIAQKEEQDKLVAERDVLAEKALKRQTPAHEEQKEKSTDEKLSENEEMALWKSLRDLGEIIKSNRATDWAVSLTPSSRDDVLDAFLGDN